MNTAASSQLDSTLAFWQDQSDSNKSLFSRKNKHKRQSPHRTELVESYGKPNEETLKAIKEAEEMERTHFANVKLYSNAEDFLEDFLTK